MLADRIGAALGLAVREIRQLPGGDLGGASLATLADGRRVVAKTGALVAKEGAMLRAISATGAASPSVLHCEPELLVMEFIESDGRAGWQSLTENLHALHAPQDRPYGWHADYAFGEVAILNSPLNDWAQFWAQRRLLPFCDHVDASIAVRIEALSARLPQMLPASPPAALLHGDLWGGNFLFNDGCLAGLIDPASYYGDREVDFAMLQVFDNPPDAVFEASDLAPGWQDRVPVYQLWPMLVHLRLFGSAYRSRVERLLSACGV
ncbi:fructosamine kinase family protein [Aurantiacibacter rhizosphaerae]|uniref:Phosphotransferase n=1 Tax=Aurantiacibacter rhizosphaerae TaxID=2691582 RepID=A0A844XHU2_9SPHN|nr:fructosamine kinase family protein [Aurantiacibacter rhizosphaerae]MWV29118.1 phosphotransferase [Aurantiacibacter rhizosphaerae]